MVVFSVWLSLFIAHLIGDFYLQTDALCRQKEERRAKSWFLYVHVLLIGALSWLAVPQWSFAGYALLILVSHWIIDLAKGYTRSGLIPFVFDQILHLLVLWGVSRCYVPDGPLPLDRLSTSMLCVLLFVVSFALCCKPTNIFIKLLLRRYEIGESKTCAEIKNAGALIGNLERMLTVIFVFIGQYEAIGFIIAAKSILRFKDTDTAKTEYVLAGTFLSFGIAVVIGLLLKWGWPIMENCYLNL